MDSEFVAAHNELIVSRPITLFESEMCKQVFGYG